MRFGVVVPARDEEALLPRCLEALEVAVAQAGVPGEVVLVLDACTDRSAEVADELRGRLALPLTVLHSTAGAVGAARATGAGYLLDRHPDPELWLATTDADSAVCPQWLARQLDHARAGATLVAGTVTVDSWTGWSSSLRRRYADRYAHPIDGGGHGHVHGANLGLSADLYRTLGGFAQLSADEDVALVAAAQAAGVTVTWATDLPVSTSARHRGRAPRGFASALRHLEAARVELR
jgi:glycosyltransferase involved in cell wall biosynthesis